MARVFLDANFLIDVVEKRKEVNLQQFLEHFLFISPLSIHILTYIYRYKIPNKKLLRFLRFFTIVSLDKTIVEKSLEGPTNDLEDNIQLHSAAQTGCDFLLTRDKNLLKSKFFGKVKIVERLV